MTLINALKNNLSHSNVPFNHWIINNPLSEKAIDEIYSINFSEGKVIFDGTRAGDKTGDNLLSKLRIFINKDNILNVPLNAGTQPHEFLNAYESIFKKLKTFKPEFILLSAGFDAHKDDPLAQINLESKDYYTLTNRILILSKKHCDGKVVSILEGGYDLNALKESVDYHVRSLLEN